MPRRLRIALVAATVLLVAGVVALDTGLLALPPRLEATPDAVARGRAFVRGNCLHCHEMIGLPRRVAGWTPRRAYDVLGDLPRANRAMPPFPGTARDRRDVAVYLSALGAGAAQAP